MKRRLFDPPFEMDGFFSFPPQTPSHEALDIADVELRIRKGVSGVSEKACGLLARAVMALVPPPPALGKHLRMADADLEGIHRFLHESHARSDEAFELLVNLVTELFGARRYLQTLRDRFERFCDHKEIIENEDGSQYCPGCGVWWRADDESRPVRMLTRRHKLPKERKGRDRPLGSAFFVYFITELLRHEDFKKKDALPIAGKLLRLFWGAGKKASEDVLRLNEAHRDGKRIALQQRLASVDDFLKCPPNESALDRVLIWIPYTKEADASRREGDSAAESPEGTP